MIAISAQEQGIADFRGHGIDTTNMLFQRGSLFSNACA